MFPFFVSIRPHSTSLLPTSQGSKLAGIALDVAGKVPTGDLEALIESIEKSGRTPSEFDSQLLGKSKTRLDALLDSKQKAEIRRQFLNACKARVS